MVETLFRRIAGLAWVAAVLACLCAAVAQGQEKELDTPYVPTPQAVVDRMLDMAQENTVAVFELARDLATVQTPSEFVEVCNARTRDSYSAFSEQTRELSELAQKVPKSAVPLTNGLASPFRQAQ